MKTMLFAAVAAVTTCAGAVELVECPKCDRWMRVSEDGKSAKVNISRLKDDAPDEMTLKRRIADMTARAESYLRRAAERPDGSRNCPLMGWSSWNTFGVDNCGGGFGGDYNTCFSSSCSSIAPGIANWAFGCRLVLLP